MDKFNAIKEEISLIHQVYDKGNKSIKPSFNFIVMEPQSEDFFVTDTLQEAKNIAIEYGNKIDEFLNIYEIIYVQGEYKANIIAYYDFVDKDVYDDFENNCLHVAWRTRGKLLGVA